MMEFLMDYLAAQGAFATAAQEQTALEAGAALFLLENGIGDEDAGDYFERYLEGRLRIIDDADLKAYLIHYPEIGTVYRIVYAWLEDGAIPRARREELIRSIRALYACGLGMKYLPGAECALAAGTRL